MLERGLIRRGVHLSSNRNPAQEVSYLAIEKVRRSCIHFKRHSLQRRNERGGSAETQDPVSVLSLSTRCLRGERVASYVRSCSCPKL